MSQPAESRFTVEFLAEEFVQRRQRGERPSVAEYAERYPSLADDIRRLFPALEKATGAKLRPGSIDATSASHDADSAASSNGTEPVQRLEHLGDFRVLREIGRGGMGIVYEAEQESLGRHVALKVLLANSLLDPKQLTRFQREARAAARLHHTNIVPVFGVGEHQGTHYYVMQYIDGRGLDSVLVELKWLRQNQRHIFSGTMPTGRTFRAAGPHETTAVDMAQALLSGQHSLESLTGRSAHGPPNGAAAASEAPPSAHSDVVPAHEIERLDLTSTQCSRQYWQSVARIGAQVADALAYAHQQGILHRDIKPANLLLDSKGTVWITDFGLAKATEQDNLTQTGDIIGTLRYMSPESFRGQYDARSDLFALGLTLYELIALRPAFDASDRNGLIRQVTHGDVPPLRRLNPSVPGDLETIVLKTLDRDPTHRYQHALDLAEDLQRFIRDEPILARRATPLERLERWCRRNPVVAALAASLIVVFLAGFAGVVWKWREAEHQRSVASRQARLATTINKFLEDDVLGAAAPEKARGRKLTVDDLLREVAPKVGRSLREEPEIEAAVQSTIGTTLLRMGMYGEAEPHLRRSLELREKVLGPDAPDTLAAVNNLAHLLKAQGRLKEAEPLYRRSYQARRRVLGPSDPETLGAMNNLGQLLLGQGKLAEAEPLLKESLEAHRRVLGPDAPDTLLAEGAYAMLLGAQGKFSEAEPLARTARDALTRALSAEHPHTLTATQNLIGLLQSQGKLSEAETLLRESLQTCRRVLGPEHPETLATLNQLGPLLLDMGQPGEAEPLLLEALGLNEKVLGEEHPRTLAMRHNVARLRLSQDRADEAEAMMRKNVEAYRRVLTSEHPDTLQAISNLAVALQSQDKLDEAEPLLREVLAAQRRVLGPEHPHTLISINNLAALLQTRGKLDEAEPLMRQYLETCTRVLGSNHPDTLLAMSNLAVFLMNQDRWNDAEPLVRQSLEARQRVLGPEHPDTLNALDDLGVLLMAQNKLDEAEANERTILEARRRVLGPEHADTLRSMTALAAIYRERDKWDEAVPLLRSVLEIHRRQRGADALDTLDAAEALAAALVAEGELEEAERLRRDRVEALGRVVGPEAPQTLAAMDSLAALLVAADKLSDAEQVVRTVLAARRRALPADHRQVAATLGTLGEMLLRRGQAAAAAAAVREAVDIDRRTLPEGDLETARLENLLGACLVELKRFDEAEDLLLASFGILQIHRAMDAAAAEQAVERIVRLYTAWGKKELAEEWTARRSPAR